MCGIAGLVNIKEKVDSRKLKAMTDVITHRGPDGEGQWVNAGENLGLGHRRLSIIDLSNAASQPMHYMDRYSIVFNGEIYNYIELREQCIAKGYLFRSSSDTEVLLALYDWKKEDSLGMLDGMFAFSIYDQKEQTLFCARDRFGEKPFYYSYEPGKHFIFGSEIKVLWAAGISKRVNNKMLFNYMAFNLIENPGDLSETFYENCTRLPHAHYLRVSVGDCRLTKIQKYYDIEWRFRNTGITEQKAAGTFLELFHTAVKRRLRSDVPVGSSLSGGLDSSLIVCIIDELVQGSAQKQKTFSACFPGFARDESQYIRMIVDKTNVTPCYTFPDPARFDEILPRVIYHQEEPFHGSSVLAQYEVMRLARENGVTVLLDGQGADEMLAGYHYYYRPFFKELLQSDKAEYKEQVDSYTKLMADNDKNEKWTYNYKDALKDKGRSVVDRFLPGMLLQKRLKNKAWINLDFFHAYREYVYYREASDPLTLNQSLYESMFKNGLQQLLRFADRNSMAHSREIRLPFLYHELVEFIFSLPPSYKINNGWTKWIMRKACENILPPAITWRKDKIGYSAPEMGGGRKIDEIKRGLIREGIININKTVGETGISEFMVYNLSAMFEEVKS